MNNGRLKGYAFEYFIKRLLLACGFTQVEPEGNIIYQDGAGLMIQGLGNSHNADVLMAPPIQIPFYYPSRILVECKCLNHKAGLQIARGVLGLREDINGFEIVTPQMLEGRRNRRRPGTGLLWTNRFQYQVALASSAGFTSSAQEFAAVHRIPLLTFESETYECIRSLLNSLDELEVTEREIQQFQCMFLDLDQDYRCTDLTQPVHTEWIKRFFDETARLSCLVQFGVLDNGSMLFLIKNELSPKTYIERDRNYEDGFSLHWSNENSFWILRNDNESYTFELPYELMRTWANSQGATREERALRMKQEQFRRIAVFSLRNSDPQISIWKLSSSFINEAVNDNNHNYGIDEEQED
jgi:hypothetical protein